ncbi:hypothetical protein HYALB_00000668, partial [Hymenoscyphus albidus]
MKKLDVTHIAQNVSELKKLIADTTDIDAENIYQGQEALGDGGMTVLKEDLLICAVLVEQRSDNGAVWITGRGNVEQVIAGPGEKNAYSLVLVADGETVAILKRPKYWLFRKRK